MPGSSFGSARPLIRKKMNPIDNWLANLTAVLSPDLRVESVLDLTSERVRMLGLNSLILDIDNTLKPHAALKIDPRIQFWVAALRKNSIRLSLLSNGREHRVKILAQQLGVPFVAEAMKPFPTRCRNLLKMHEFDPARTAIVGDQLFADVLAGRLAGVFTILVRPMDLSEPWFTRVKRPVERFFLDLAQRSNDGTYRTRRSAPGSIGHDACQELSAGPGSARTTPQRNDPEPTPQ